LARWDRQLKILQISCLQQILAISTQLSALYAYRVKLYAEDYKQKTNPRKDILRRNRDGENKGYSKQRALYGTYFL